ncbi:MAG TPA: hypothetical protein VMH34_01485 [Gammaproteobacteria bacterium]|nr:hypothetical protein [Gammaproteobacteria bacterium]
MSGPLIFDDYPQISPLLGLDSSPQFDWRGYVLSNSGLLGRPVAMASFLMNALSSGPDIFAWKYSNVMLHVLIGMILIWLSACLLSTRREAAGTSRDWLPALAVGGFWLLHPLHVSTVLYVVQRMAQLSALFCFAGMLCYWQGRQLQIENRKGGHLMVMLTYLVFMPLAAFSKENGALLPVYTLLMEVYFLKFKGDRPTRRTVTGSFILFLLVPGFVGMFVLLSEYHYSLKAAYALRDFNLPQRLLTEQRILLLYMSQILAPALAKYGLFHDDIPISTDWLTPPSTLVAGMVLLLLAWIAWKIRDRRPVVGFGIAFFFAGHLMESTVLPLELVFEHRNYLPSYGLLLAACDLIRALNWPVAVNTTLALVVGALLSLVLGLHVDKWSSYPAMLAYFTQTHPQSPRVRASVAEYLTGQRRYQDALRLLEGEQIQGALFQRLYIRCRSDHRLPEGALEQATNSLSHALDNYAMSGLIEVGRQGLDDGCQFDHDGFLELMKRADKLGVPAGATRYKLLIYQAHYQWSLRRFEDAMATLLGAYNILPDDPVPLFLMTEWLISLKRVKEAHMYYDKAVRVSKASHKDYSAFVKNVGLMFDAPEKAAHWQQGDLS